MTTQIVNASPQVINLGTNDKSLKPTPPRPIVIPTHIPFIAGFAAGGPSKTKEFVDGARFLGLYGPETVDRQKPYFTHTTRLVELMSAAGNAFMYARIVPDDNDTIANVTIYVDMLKTDVDVYKRHDDGSIAYDDNGDPIVDKTVKGYKLKIIAEFNDVDEDDAMGTYKAKQGYQTDGDGNKSTMYPIMEFRAKYKGSKYNNFGIALELPTHDAVNEKAKESNVALPWEVYFYKREDANSTGKIVKSLFGSETDQFVFVKNATDPVTNRKIDFNNIEKEWYNLNNPLRDLVYPMFEKTYVYYDYYDYVTKTLMEVEKDYVNADVNTVDGHTVNTSEWLDYLTDKEAMDQYRILNPFTCMSTKRVPSFTYLINDDDIELDENHEEIYISKATPVYLRKGKDGTLSEENLEKGVKEWMAKYIDKNSEVMDLAINLENVFYDSGFTIVTKKELVNFITVRKDTFLGLSTREFNLGEKYVDLVTERAIAVNLKARLALAPESTFFGTPVTRGIVVAGNGIDNLDPSENRYGLLMDIAYKAARMMGGKEWKKELMFDRGDKNMILNYSDIQPAFIPQGVKPDLWNIGLIWPQPYDRAVYHFPAMQSVYDNDTSVLNNIFMAIALTVVNKVAAAAWRKFTGDTSMSTNEFLDAVETYMNNELKNKFGGIINVSCKAMITDFDEERGYSWTVVSKVSGNVMKTVMTHYIEAWNKEDM